MATFVPLLFSILCLSALSFGTAVLDDGSTEEEYVLDAPFTAHPGSLRGRFQAAAITVKKGSQCSVTGNNICDGVSANQGKSLLKCCKKHCRNILGDRDNCGVCGKKCGFGQLCCGSTCTNVGFNSSHCGKCNKACSLGVECSYGVCGYA